MQKKSLKMKLKNEHYNWVIIKDKLLGFILLGDLLRDDSIKTVQNLRKQI